MPTKHEVQQGECLARIAARYGFFDARIIYDHPDNADFKRKRPNPNVILPGDVIVIPDKAPATVTVATGIKHRFVIRRTPRMLRLAVADADRVRLKNTKYVLRIDGRELSGVTNGDGILEHEIPIDAEDATLIAGGFEWPLKVGHLDPSHADDDGGGVAGAQARLRNLGYHPGELDGDLGPKTEAALRAFQLAQGLPDSGELDDATRAKLLETHGC